MPVSNKLRDKLEKAIMDLLDGKETDPEKGRIKLSVINSGIKWEAVKNKIDEAGWGDGVGDLGKSEGTDDE